MSLPPKTSTRAREPWLHDNAPKEVTTQRRVAVIETIRSWVFTRSPNAERVARNDALKRVTTPTGVAVVGVGALGFRRKNPPRTWYLQPSTFSEPSFPHMIWAMSSPPTPGDPKDHSFPPTWSKEMDHHHRNAAQPSRRSCSPPTGAATPAPWTRARGARPIVQPARWIG
jgi:hypothetical protein